MIRKKLSAAVLAASLGASMAAAPHAVALAESCWSVPSVVESARFERNAEFGGHLPLHFRTSTPPFFRHPYDTQDDKSLFDTRDEYAAAVGAAKAAANPPDCPSEGGKVTQTVPASGPAFHCHAALNDGTCATASRFQIKSVKFVFCTSTAGGSC